MKKFFITKIQPVTKVLTYYVEAESEEEAISKIEKGEVDYGEVDYEENGYSDDCEYEVEIDD